jgi:hypothetical protein
MSAKRPCTATITASLPSRTMIWTHILYKKHKSFRLTHPIFAPHVCIFHRCMHAFSTRCRFVPSSDLIVSSSRDKLIKVWDSTTGYVIRVCTVFYFLSCLISIFLTVSLSRRAVFAFARSPATTIGSDGFACRRAVSLSCRPRPIRRCGCGTSRRARARKCGGHMST